MLKLNRWTLYIWGQKARQGKDFKGMVPTDGHSSPDQGPSPETRDMLDQGNNNITEQKEMPDNQSRSEQRTPQTSTVNFPRCIACRCGTCNQVKADCHEIKKMLEKLDTKNIHEVSTDESSTASVNLCS